MADIERAKQALINAHNAGDVEAATQLANYIKTQSAPQSVRPPNTAEKVLRGTAGVIDKVTGAVIDTAAKLPADILLPSRPYKPTDLTVGDVASKAASTIGKIPTGSQSVPTVGERVVKTAQGIGRGVDVLEQKFPNAMADIEAGLTVGSAIYPAAKAGGAALAVSKPVARSVAKGALEAVTPSVDENIKPLARRAQEMGIKLRIDQVAPTRVRNTVQKLSQNVPFSGVDAFEKQQLKDWTRGVAKTIGQDTDTLGPETIINFKSSNSSLFDTALKDKLVSVSPDDISFLKGMKQKIKRGLSSGNADQVIENIDAVISDIKGPLVFGEKLANIRSDLLEAAVTSDKGVPVFLGRIVDHIDSIAARSLTEQEVKNLDLARRQWRNFKTIKPLLEKSSDGMIKPTDLMNRIASNPYIDASKTIVGKDDLVDLARIGKAFLPKKGGSDTIPNVIVGGSVATLAPLIATNPVLAAGKVATEAGVVGANKLYQLGVTNQKTIKRMVQEKK